MSTVAVIILVGNKTDLAELREVSAEEGQEYAAQCARAALNDGASVASRGVGGFTATHALTLIDARIGRLYRAPA